MQSENDLILVSDRRKELIQANKLLKESAFSEFETISSKTIKIGKIALWVGGTFALTYFVFGLFFSRKKKVITLPSTELAEEQKSVVILKDDKDSYFNLPIVKKIMDAIAGFLIAIARQKLIDLLTELNQPKASDVVVTQK